MSVLLKAMDVFWNGFVAKSDAKLHATQTEPTGIVKICDIPYINDGHRLHLLDVYYPESRDGNLPAIIDVHGGGWMYGDKELNRIYCLNLAERGFTVFNISYRLVPEVSAKEQIQDVMYALKWIKQNMSGYPCTDDVMLTGDSAGGMLASYAACIMSSDKLRSVFDTVNPNLKIDCLLLTSPVAYMNAGGVMGVYTRKMLAENISGKTSDYLNLDSLLPFSQLPPTFMITSSGDTLGLKQTRRAAADFEKSGVILKLIDLPKFEGKNLPHVFSVLKPESKAGNMVIDEALEFFKDIISQKIKEQ